MPSDDLDQIAAELYNDLGLHEVCILEDEPAILAAIADALRHQRAAGEQVMHVAWSAKLAEAQQQIEALTAEKDNLLNEAYRVLNKYWKPPTPEETP